MLNSKKITLEAKTVVNGTEIMGWRAIFTPGSTEDVSFLPYQIDKAACKENRVIVRADQAEFEDYAYELQEKLAQGAE